jgi:NAD(P)-dependent dehydrogenase (short-subunit alcohol dehydrogenase family)
MSASNMQDLAGQVAMVTGSAQGIGEAIARKFAANGAKVVVADIQLAKAQNVAASINEAGGVATAIAVDISQPESLLQCREHINAALGPVTLLVNNAAVIPIKPFFEMSWEDWNRTINTNLSGTYYASRVFIDDMLAAGHGNIIVISSVNGLRAQVGLSAYNVSKAGLIMLAQTMALELASYNIRVNAIAPGDIATAVIENVNDESEALANIPLQRWGKPDEIAEIALFLASSRSSYTTGSVFGCDGGLAAQLYPFRL